MTEFGFIHIGKTGGTAVKAVLRQCAKRGVGPEIGLYPHIVTFKEIVSTKLTENVIFFVREPVSRYVSAFNSRLRKGYPRHNYPWNADEAVAFGLFKTANDLAEALSSDQPTLRARATAAMTDIKHLMWNYQHYLGSVTLLEEQQGRIYFIGTAENLTSDFSLLRKSLNLPDEIELPTGDIEAHKTPEGFDTHVSAVGRKNLESFYMDDYGIYEWCLKRRDQLLVLRGQAFQRPD